MSEPTPHNAEKVAKADRWDDPLPRYATTVRDGRVKRVRCVCCSATACAAPSPPRRPAVPDHNADAYTGYRTKPNLDQPDRCPSIDPHDTLQCGRRIHKDDQCQYGGIGWKKGTRPPHEQHHPWGPLEAALVATLTDWSVECDARPAFGEGSDCSDLMDLALTRIKGLCSRALDPDAVMAEIEGGEVEGCDCTELCAMGPTCPGGMLARLPGTGCIRSDTRFPPGQQREDGAR